jgi:hypothetical protein
VFGIGFSPIRSQKHPTQKQPAPLLTGYLRFYMQVDTLLSTSDKNSIAGKARSSKSAITANER